MCIRDSHWAFGVINLGTELEIVKGFPDGTFKPDKPVTKAEYAVMLWRMYRGLGGTDVYKRQCTRLGLSPSPQVK